MKSKIANKMGKNECKNDKNSQKQAAQKHERNKKALYDFGTSIYDINRRCMFLKFLAFCDEW